METLPNTNKFYDEESPEEIRPGFVEDDNRADYYLELLIDKQKEVNRLQERIEALEYRIEKIRNGMSYYKMMLEQYMEGLNKANPKHKTHPLAFGDLTARKMPDKVEVTCELTDAEYDKDTDFVNMNVSYQADKKAIKDAAKNGVPIPAWATITEGETRYSVKIRDDAGKETEL